jgi:hypothetical protein
VTKWIGIIRGTTPDRPLGASISILLWDIFTGVKRLFEDISFFGWASLADFAYNPIKRAFGPNPKCRTIPTPSVLGSRQPHLPNKAGEVESQVAAPAAFFQGGAMLGFIVKIAPPRMRIFVGGAGVPDY